MKPMFSILCLAVAACAQTPTEVPVVVERKMPPAPRECSVVHPKRLTPIPQAKDGDRIEDFAAAVGRNHRQNDKQYRALLSDRSICGVYVDGLNKIGHGS